MTARKVIAACIFYPIIGAIIGGLVYDAFHGAQAVLALTAIFGSLFVVCVFCWAGIQLFDRDDR